MDFILDGIAKAFLLLLDFDPETYSAVFATVTVTSYSMTASLLIGIPLGLALGYKEFPGKKQVRTVVDTLLALPTVFIGLLVYAMLSYRGPLGEMGLLFTLPGIAVGQTILALPVVVALTATAIEGMDDQLRVTVMSLGANKRQLFSTCLWETRFAILTGAMTAYGKVLTEVGISMMVGGNIKWQSRTITTAIALETNKGQFAMGIALGLVLLFIAFVVNASLSFLRSRR
jgi:tungstate transport system permease protein